MKQVIIFYLILFLASSLCSATTGKIIYVDADAPGPVHDGTSWTNAFKYLQDALAEHYLGYYDDDEIRVAEGTYTPDRSSTDPNGSGDRTATFGIILMLTLRGGYAGYGQPDPNKRDIELYETILSGDLNGNDAPVAEPCDLLNEPTRQENSYHVVTRIETDEMAVLDGFTITAGNANGSVFINDPINYGGGMYNYLASPTVTNCTFSANSAFLEGGGIYNYDNSNPKITNCTFNENSADVGGGMCNSYRYYSSSPTVTNCTFNRNSGNLGGGMYNGHNSKPNITNCTFSGNWALYGGGGMYVSWSKPTVTNCTFNGNAADAGGGLYIGKGSNSSLTNCILWSNTANLGNEIYLFFFGSYPSAITVNYSDVQGGPAGVYVEPGSTLNWGLGNIDCDPCFVEPGYWDTNNTPEDTNDDFWVDGDYHLKSAGWRWDTQRELWTWDEVTSRCIDAGNPGSSLGEEPLSVPDDPNNEWGENLRINMGAYGGTAEASIPPYGWALLADITNDGTVDFTDMKYFSEDWLNAESECPADLNRDSSVDMFDYALFAEDWLLETSWK